jgi:hypothetical protein
MSHHACAILSRRHPLQIVPPPHRNSDFCTVHDVASVQSRPRRPLGLAVAPRTCPMRPWHAPAAAVPPVPLLHEHVLCRRVTRSPFRLLPCSQALPDCDRQTIQMMNRRKRRKRSVALRRGLACRESATARAHSYPRLTRRDYNRPRCLQAYGHATQMYGRSGVPITQNSRAGRVHVALLLKEWHHRSL